MNTPETSLPPSTRPPARPRLCLVSDCLAQPLEEGGRVIACGLAEGLHAVCETLALGTHPASPPPARGEWVRRPRELIRRIRAFAPDVLLTFPHASNTVPALAGMRWLARQAGAPFHAFLAYQPRRHSGLAGALQRRLAPNLLLCPAERSVHRLRDEGLAAARLPLGVDLTRFRPAGAAAKRQLRLRHNLPTDARLAMHAGHAKPGRNLELMIAACRRAGWDGLVALSSFGTPDSTVLRRLDGSGFYLFCSVPAIDELYQSADCYLFPVQDELSCAEIPLSVLEALACGLPVVSTPFGGLPDLLPTCENLVYAEREDEFVEALKQFEGGAPRRPPEIEALSWTNVARHVLALIEAARS